MEKIITIVIPVFNREQTIVRCLDSVAAQNCADSIELIVVDNNSTDKSVETITQWRKCHPQIELRLLSESKKGAAAARNKGLKDVRTEYVMFFDSDDEMLSGHLQRIIDAINNNQHIDILGWDIECVLSSGRNYRSMFFVENALRNQMIYSTLATQKYIVKTAFINQVGGWNESMMGWNDFELGVRLILANPKMIKVADDKPLVRTYFSENSITGRCFSSAPSKWEDSLNEIQRNISERRPELLWLVDYRRAILAGNYAREGAKKEAHRLLADALNGDLKSSTARMAYWITRLFGRGARFVIAFKK